MNLKSHKQLLAILVHPSFCSAKYLWVYAWGVSSQNELTLSRGGHEAQRNHSRRKRRAFWGKSMTAWLEVTSAAPTLLPRSKHTSPGTRTSCSLEKPRLSHISCDTVKLTQLSLIRLLPSPLTLCLYFPSRTIRVSPGSSQALYSEN